MKVRRLEPGAGSQARYKRIQWVLDYYEGKKRIRKFFKSKGEAEAERDTIKGQHRDVGQSWLDLTPAERSDLLHVVHEARERKVTVRQVWEAYKNGKLNATSMKRISLKDAIEETIKWRRGENLRERYLHELEAYLRKFAMGRNDMFIDQVGVAEIQTWFDGRNEALSTKRANIGRLGSLFDVAWKQDYIKENPCLKLPTIKLDQAPPQIFTPDQAKKILKIARQNNTAALPYVVLGMFAGIRPEEMEKLKWGDIDTKHGTVTVDAAAAKTNRRRVVHLHATAQEWAKLFKRGKDDAPLFPVKITLRRQRRKIRDSGIEWSQDVLRHTAGSYMLALKRNAHEVALELGNSARILERHYKDLVTPTDCAEFWKLTPKEVAKRKRGKK